VLTVGHSTRAIQDFIYLLQVHGVTRVVDVRSIPRSRHNPQFNAESLPRSLAEAGIGYLHLAGLGGLRHSVPDSPTWGGAMLHFGVSPTICKRRLLKKVWPN